MESLAPHVQQQTLDDMGTRVHHRRHAALMIEGYWLTDLDAPAPEDTFVLDKIFWMPTVSMSLDVKKALPKEGEEWLRIRISAKVVKNRRYEAEVIVFDEDGDVVVLGTHVALVSDGERNWGRKEKL
ncbi:thioesterase family [Fusarium napiforme]|uniref:Thioesterase family n=1 Tax=Fusarium napiforme TaxID=42672 RepID=A0A8H5K6B3_9HYPO|nr:thioesterase family [Fusarium napiforme]